MASRTTKKLWPGMAPQTDERPPPEKSHENPNDSLKTTTYLCLKGEGTPDEAFRYDQVYDVFKSDEAFRTEWKIGDMYDRMSPDESMAEGNAVIHVVMDLMWSKLHPTNYTPGAGATRMHRQKAQTAHAEQHDLPKSLPAGYSVPLDVWLLEDAKVFLESQREKKGVVDAKYKWLEEAVKKHKKVPAPEDADANKVQPRPKQQARRPSAEQGAAADAAPLALADTDAFSDLNHPFAPLQELLPRGVLAFDSGKAFNHFEKLIESR